MSKVRVLLVDDEADLVEIIEERLHLRGIEAAVSSSGQDALTRMRECVFNVVVVDVRMPSMGGLELLGRIKKICPKTQVILLTGRGSEEESKIGLAQGAFDYLIKPVNINDLIATLERAVAAGQASE
jgi:DNA-binding NtrC family response regulator